MTGGLATVSFAAAFVVVAVIVSTPAEATHAGAYPMTAGGYTFTDSTVGGPAYAFASIAASGVVQTPPDEDWTPFINFPTSPPMKFRFFDQCPTQFRYNDNGILMFTSYTGTTFTRQNTFPDASIQPHGLIAMFWADLDTTVPGAAAYYQFTGTAPNRILTIQYSGYHVFGAQPSQPPIQFQAQLFERTGEIRIHYENLYANPQGAISGGLVWNGGIGVENAAATQGGGLPHGVGTGLHNYHRQAASMKPVNNPPLAPDVPVSVLEGSLGAAITLPGSDPDCNDTPWLTFSYTQPQYGTVTGAPTAAAPVVTYVPDGDFYGVDSFTYTVTDLAGIQRTGRVTVTVDPVNDAPRFTSGPSPTLVQGAGAQRIAWATAIGPGGTFTLTAPDECRLPPTFVATPCRDGVRSVTTLGTVNDNVQQVRFTTAVTGTTGSLAFATAPKVHPDVLSGAPYAGPLGTGTDWGDLTFTPTDSCGTATVQVGAVDDGGTANAGVDQSTLATFTITVTCNAAPVAVADGYTTPYQTALAVPAPGVLGNDNDPDGSPLSAVLVAGPTHAQSFTLHPAGSFTYTPVAGYSGLDTFTYRASDGVRTSAVTTVTITIGGPSANAPPNAVNDAYTAAYELTLQIAAPGVLGNDNDPDGNAITAVAASGATAQGGTYVLNADGSFTYTPPNTFTGTDSFTYRASDASAQSNQATVTFTVAAPAPPSELKLTSLTVGNGQAGTIARARLEYSDDGGPAQVTFVLTTLTSHGDLFVSGAQVVATGAAFTQADINALKLTYRHDGSPTVTDSFVFFVRDGHGLETSSRTFPIDILAGGGEPFPADDAITVQRNVVDVPIDVLDNDVDGNGDALTIVSATTPRDANGVPRGSAVVAGGHILFTPAPGAWEGTATFQYTITDGTTQASATVTVTIQDPAQPSVALSAPSGTLCSGPLSFRATAHRTGAAPAWSWNVGAAWQEAPYALVSTQSFTLPKGTFTVQAKADWGDVSITTQVTVSVLRCQAPSAAFTCTPQGVSLRFAPETTTGSHAWDFGDGMSSTQAAPLHRYATNGTYAVTHTVTDDEALVSQTTQSCHLPAILAGVDATSAGGAPFRPAPAPSAPPAAPAPTKPAAGVPMPNRPPIARAGLDLSVLAGDQVTLDGSASYDPDGDLITFHWTQIAGPTVDLHDATTPRPWFIAAAGTAEFRLDVSDAAATSSDTVVATGTAPRSLVDWWVRLDGATARFAVAGPTDAAYAWEFGDGASSSAREPAHVYLAPGTYVVRLVVTIDGTETASVRAIEITTQATGSPAPAASLDVPTATVPMLPIALMASLGLLALVAIVVALRRLRR